MVRYRIIQRCQFSLRDDTSEKRSQNGWTKFLISYIHRGQKRNVKKDQTRGFGGAGSFRRFGRGSSFKINVNKSRLACRLKLDSSVTIAAKSIRAERTIFERSRERSVKRNRYRLWTRATRITISTPSLHSLIHLPRSIDPSISFQDPLPDLPTDFTSRRFSTRFSKYLLCQILQSDVVELSINRKKKQRRKDKNRLIRGKSFSVGSRA